MSDRYLVRGVLGEGGMGMVYEAEHVGLGRQVAIKVLNPSQAKKRVAVKRFQQEARAAGAIGHPNICEVYDLGLLDDGSPYLVMEKLVGTTLADRIQREAGLPFEDIIDVMIQVLSGLIAAHDKGIVHRDIKPENIFLARRVGCAPIVKILDFGVSKMMPQFQGGDEQLDLTRTGMVMGTPYYMSPEQARGERNLDGRVDVYACGVMMYEAIAGKRPFLAPNYNALLLSIINTTPKSLHEVRPATPVAMEEAVIRMMAKARDDRYPTANAVLRDLQALPSTAVLSARMVAPPSMARPANRASDRAARVEEPPGVTLKSRTSEPPPARRPPAPSDSFSIPVHVSDTDLRTFRPGGAVDDGPDPDLHDEMPTEIFRPGQHRGAPARQATAPPRPASVPPPPPADAPPALPPSLRRPSTIPVSYPQVPVPSLVQPVLIGNPLGPTGDEWDSETVVQKPPEVAATRHTPPVQQRPPKPFNVEATVNIKGDAGFEVDFSDDPTVPPPKRRS